MSSCLKVLVVVVVVAVVLVLLVLVMLVLVVAVVVVMAASVTNTCALPLNFPPFSFSFQAYFDAAASRFADASTDLVRMLRTCDALFPSDTLATDRSGKALLVLETKGEIVIFYCLCRSEIWRAGCRMLLGCTGDERRLKNQFEIIISAVGRRGGRSDNLDFVPPTSHVTRHRDLPSAKVMAGCELIVENACRAAASCVLKRAQVSGHEHVTHAVVCGSCL